MMRIVPSDMALPPFTWPAGEFRKRSNEERHTGPPVPAVEPFSFCLRGQSGKTPSKENPCDQFWPHGARNTFEAKRGNYFGCSFNAAELMQ